ncbi:LysR family transcriptional regulator [Mycobacterium sp. AT1]|uniref:LysR family transcriptional regulator n=1 Tax=Mycobacterium sp. AT1 TaxID=1961706 RepID=UPI0009AD31D3|nr:LysR family transcriptional regulator [Mycobacterium sp. AT1]OPX05333.1 hypothetical protein B1790_32635 [Mycobacterium sp. AT1]
MLDVRKMRMLTELERLGTVTAVAEELKLAAPGVSIQLRSLERELGLKLIERRGRRVGLTAAGKVLAAHGRGVLDLLTAAEMDVRALREGTTGTYRVAAFPTAARSFVADAWSTALSAPGVVPPMTMAEMEPPEALSALGAGTVDLAVTHAYSNVAPVSVGDLSATQVLTESVRLAVSTTDARVTTRTRVGLEEFNRDRWIVPRPVWSCYQMIERACGAAGFVPDAIAEATDFTVQLALVRAGVGVALIPELGCQVLPEGVRLLELHQPVFRYVFSLARATSVSDVGLGRLTRHIVEAAEAIQRR